MSLDAESIVDKIEKAGEMYHRLVLVVAPSGSGKTAVLNEIDRAQKTQCTNVNLELSKRMLDLTAKQRALQAVTLLREAVGDAEATTVVLDNLEILFDLSLHLDPLRVLKELARQRTVVASWNGQIDDRGLIYGEPDHPEYRHYSPSEIDFLTVTIAGKAA